MLNCHKKIIFNSFISKFNIKHLNNLPKIKKLTLSINYNNKSSYLIMTTFFLFYFLSDTKPILKSFSKKQLQLSLKTTKINNFLYAFNYLFFKQKKLKLMFFSINNVDNIKKCRVFLYSLQIFFLELFFFKNIHYASWNHLVFKLELLFYFNSKNSNNRSIKNLLNFYFS